MSKFKIRESYLLLLIVLGLVSLGIYTTYALFTASTTINDVVGITATLDIGKSLTEYEVITVQPNETKLIELNVVNSYNGNIYYGAWYQIVKGNSNDIDIGLYTEKNSNPGSGSLSASSNINLLVGITNNSTSSITLYIGVKGSLTNELNLGNNKILIPDGFTEPLSVTVNITNGTINNSTISTIKVKKGNDATFNVIPNDGYQLGIDTQTCNGTLIGEGIFTISNITENKECSLTLKEDGPIKKGSLADHIITTYTSNNAVSTRTDFSDVFTETNDKIYTTNKTEDGSTVYYYAGNTTHNWVKFGKFASSDTPDNFGSKKWNSGDDMYWRIIRTNEDGSIRMLYSGNSHSSFSMYIGISAFNDTDWGRTNVRYMWGQYIRDNINSSAIKKTIDNWYVAHLINDYDKYVSKTAIYCNDLSSQSNNDYYGAYTRIYTNKTPTYRCGGDGNGGLFESEQAIADKFSSSETSGGNGKLKCSTSGYTTSDCPIALMTVDEVVFAGGKNLTQPSSPYVWYYTNSTGAIDNGSMFQWWTMSPANYDNNNPNTFFVSAMTQHGMISYQHSLTTSDVRPVLSLKSCVKYSSGDGTPTNPYTVTIDDDCASKEN